MKSAVLLFAAALLCGCAAGHLYPVQGPLAAQTPVPIYSIKMDAGDSMTARLAHGQVCHGTWLDIAQNDPDARDMAAEWDLVYGDGFFLAHVLGNISIARAILTCPKDTKLNAEFDSVKGVAKDSNGDVFKLTF
jgi:hypothetical protein